MSKEKIDLRAYQNEPEFKQEEILRREAHLLQIGLKPETVEEYKKTRPGLIDPGQVDSVMDTLQTLVYNGKSFSDPKKLVESNPFLLNSDSSKFKDNLLNLEQMGFTDPVALATKNPKFLYSDPKTLKENFTTLQTLVYKGKSFSDPKKLVESSLSLLTSDSSKFTDRLYTLEQMGFTDPVALVTKIPSLLVSDPKTLKENFTTLQTLVYKGKSFSDPKKLVESNPFLLNSDSSKFEDNLHNLEQMGFTDPVALATKEPSFLYSNPERLKQNFTTLQTLVYKGKSFSDPKKLVDSKPWLLTSDSSKFADNLQNLEEMGFTDPVALVTKEPSLLYNNPEMLKQKLVELKKMGFIDPTALVEKYPKVLDSKSQSMRHRVRLLGKILQLYELPFQENQLMERVFPFFTAKLDKMMVLARLLREYQVVPEELTESLMNQMLFSNLEDVLVALSDKPAGEDIHGFMKRVKELKKQKLDKTFKREWIESSLEDSKIKQRYLTGYPKKAEKGSGEAEAAEDEIGN